MKYETFETHTNFPYGNESTVRWKWQGSKDILQVSQALGTLGITITCA